MQSRLVGGAHGRHRRDDGPGGTGAYRRRATRREVRRATLRVASIVPPLVVVVVGVDGLQAGCRLVSAACSSRASSAETSPMSTRSSGLMKPSLMRKPPA